MNQDSTKLSQGQGPEQHWASGEEIIRGSSKKLFKFLSIIIFIAILFLGVFLGYSYYKGYRLKMYSDTVSPMMEKVKEWENLSLAGYEYIADDEKIIEARKKINNIRFDSEKFLDTLNSSKVPEQAENLNVKLRDYFTLNRGISAEFVNIIDFVIGVREIDSKLKDQYKLLSQANSYNDFVKIIEETKNIVNGISSKINFLEIPESYRETHEDVKDFLQEYSYNLDMALRGIKSNNIQQFEEGKAGIVKAEEKLVVVLSSDDAATEWVDYLYEKENALEDMRRDILRDIDLIKNIIFVF